MKQPKPKYSLQILMAVFLIYEMFYNLKYNDHSVVSDVLLFIYLIVFMGVSFYNFAKEVQ